MPDQPRQPDQPDRPDHADRPGGSGDPTRPWEQPTGSWPGWQDGGSSQPQYPRQNLLPQEIKPGRNRKPLYIAIAVVIALVIAGGAAYLVLRDDGEGTREAYCAALRDLSDNGDLMSAVEGADARTADKLKAAIDLAPDVVADDWKKLESAVGDAQSGSSPDMSQALTLFASLRAIAQDAKDNCDLELGIPMI
jgi:hypothetical protein